MKKVFVSVFLAFVMLFSMLPISGAAAVKEASAESVVFGSYPCERVTDEAALSALNALVSDFDALALSGGGYMRYMDISFGGDEYRAVRFSSYRPVRANEVPAANNSEQDENGYAPGNIYFFKFVSLEWDVLDKEEGLLISRNVIDAQSFNEGFSILDSGIWSVSSVEFPNYYANTYMISGLDAFLNDEGSPCSFINTAFDGDQQLKLESMDVDNSDSMGNTDEAYYPDFNYSAKVKVLSATEVNAYFPEQGSSTRNMGVTDYAKCMGLGVNYENKAGFWTSSRWLSSPPQGVLGSFSKNAVYVPASGSAAGANAVPVDTLSGVRPVIKISGDHDITDITIRFNSVPVAGDVPTDIFKLDVPEDHYKISAVIWSVNGSSFSTATPTFQKGSVYIARLTLKANEGRAFADKVNVTSEGCSVLPVSAVTEGKLLNVYYSFSVPELEPVRGGELAIGNPVIGEKIADITELREAHLIKSVSWHKYYPLTRLWVVPKEGAAFSEGIYRLTVTITPEDGYYIPESFLLNVGSVVVPYQGPDITVTQGKITVEAFYELSDSLSLVALGGEGSPSAGETVSDNTGDVYACDNLGNIISGAGDVPRAVEFDTENGCFWYEGSKASSPEPLSGDSVFETGKIYTFRYVFRAADGYSFASGVSFTHNGLSGKSPSFTAVGDDGAYIVDFTYSLVDERIDSVRIEGIALPVGGSGFTPSAEVPDGAEYEINAESGWYGDMGGETVTPEIGCCYYTRLVLFAKPGYCFPDEPELSFTGQNGEALSPESAEYQCSTFSRDNDMLTVYIELKCSEGRIASAAVLDLSVPEEGERLDYTAKSAYETTDVVYIAYYMGGKKLSPGFKPSQGDLIDIYIGVKPSKAYADAGYVFDDEMYLTIWENEPESVRAQRDASLPAGRNFRIFKFRYAVPYVYYDVKVDKGAASPEKAVYGTVVTIEARPQSGMVFSKWNVTSGDITLADPYAQKTTFTMPFSDVSVEAVYRSSSSNTTVPSSDNKLDITLGDVDFDGRITSADARLALRRAVNLEKYKAGSDEFIACDITRDGKVTAEDARLILRASVRLEDPTKW